jgi:hypothetical protein
MSPSQPHLVALGTSIGTLLLGVAPSASGPYLGAHPAWGRVALSHGEMALHKAWLHVTYAGAAGRSTDGAGQGEEPQESEEESDGGSDASGSMKYHRRRAGASAGAAARGSGSIDSDASDEDDEDDEDDGGSSGYRERKGAAEDTPTGPLARGARLRRVGGAEVEADPSTAAGEWRVLEEYPLEADGRGAAAIAGRRVHLHGPDAPQVQEY